MPAEKKTVSLDLDKSMFTAVNEKGERAVYSKEFTLYAGVSQPDPLSEKLCGCSCARVEIRI
jgi:beta-glucosidase